jgi:hypothetical protein
VTLEVMQLPAVVHDAWRIEEKPAGDRPRTEDYFANVMLASARDSRERPAIDNVRSDDAAVSFRVTLPDGTRVSLRFAKGAAPLTSLRLERAGRMTFDGVLPNAVRAP